MIENKIELNERNGTYVLKIYYPINRITSYRFCTNEISNEVRKLFNGKNSLQGLNNRDFFKKYFVGGSRKVLLEDVEGVPNLVFYFILVSTNNQLDLIIKNQIGIRLKLINPSFKFDFYFVSKEIVEDKLNSTLPSIYETNIDDVLNKHEQLEHLIGIESTKDVIKLLLKKPNNLGKLYNN
jgi:hypothetical protein